MGTTCITSGKQDVMLVTAAPTERDTFNWRKKREDWTLSKNEDKKHSCSSSLKQLT